MALGTFTPGEYVMTYDSSAIGMCMADGKSLQFRDHQKKINNTDRYGDTRIDGIYRGKDVFLRLIVKEWTAGVKKMLWPWSVPAAPVFDGKLGLIGQLASDCAKVLVLTPVANTPAATNGPASLTANKAILAPENDVSILFGPDERDIPLLLDLLPYDDTGVIRMFTLT